jgi:hypothetical protein
MSRDIVQDAVDVIFAVVANSAQDGGIPPDTEREVDGCSQ